MTKFLPLPFLAALAILALLTAAPVTAAELGGEAARGEVNGLVWLASENHDKLSFLLGVESAIAMEHAIAASLAEKNGKAPPLSSFHEGWMKAFEQTSRPKLAAAIDAYYRDNPSQRNRHVFDVVWTEMIVPAVSGR